MSCPMCNKDSVAKYRPFCSRRCADLDLGNWLDNRYSAPVSDLEDEDYDPTTAAVLQPKPH